MLLRLLLIVSVLALVVVPASPALYFVERQSVLPDGSELGAAAYGQGITWDSYVTAFTTFANPLPVPDNGQYDAFLRHRTYGHAIDPVSVAADGTQGNGVTSYGTRGVAITPDGRFVAFFSYASTLVPGDANGMSDVFVRDRFQGTVTLVSRSSGGQQGDADSGSHGLAISADGRWVAFSSNAENLVAGDTNGREDVFVRDQVTGTTQRVSVASDGTQAEGGISTVPVISGDGRYVAFVSCASNLAPGDTTDGDVFRHDRVTGETAMMTVSTGGQQANLEGGWGSDSLCISGDGRYVCFTSVASNLVPGDTNGKADVFRHDNVTGETMRVSVSDSGEQATGESDRVYMSDDGRYVVFASAATNLLWSGDTPYPDGNGCLDVYVRDTVAGDTRRVSITNGRGEADGDSYPVAMTGDGRYVLYNSLATNLVAGDTNGVVDIYLTYNPTYVEPLTAPAAPTDLAATPIGGTQVSLTWADHSNNETGFFVEQSIAPDSGFVQVGATMYNTPGYVDWGLTPMPVYYYRVRAFNETGLSAYSNTVAVSWAPGNLKATPLSASAVRLTWTDVAGESGYVVERALILTAAPPPKPPLPEVVATLAANATAWTNTGLLRGSTYCYWVRATHPAGDSARVDVAVTMPSFDDVLPASQQYGYVEAIYREGITAGCGQTPPLYCPNASITRGQMAVFLCRAAGWSPLDAATPSFSDVPKADPQYGYVERLLAQGVTAGCGGGKYCPASPVTRGQMAVFLCRAAGLAVSLPATPTFTDVPKTSGQFSYVEGLYAAGVTAGCVTTPPRQYCPSSPVTRGQMAVFLVRAFAIPLVR